MDKMIDLAMTDADRKAQSAVYEDTSTGDGPKYPWGLRLHLNQETMAKIGELPAVGTELTLTIRVKVTEYSQEEVEINDKTVLRKSGALQVTGIQMPGGNKTPVAEKMYPQNEKVQS